MHAVGDKARQGGDGAGLVFGVWGMGGQAIEGAQRGGGLVQNGYGSAGSSDARHLAHGFEGIVDELQAAHLEDMLEGVIVEGHELTIGMEEARRARPLGEVSLGTPQHIPGDVQAVVVRMGGKVGDVQSGADGGFEHAIAGIDGQLGDIIAADAGLGAVIELGAEVEGKVVSEGSAVVKPAVEAVPAGKVSIINE